MNYWSLFLLIFPIWAIIGNSLVIVSVYKEKLLHNLTNYLIVNLAIADLMVGIFAMPFHIYVSVKGEWDLGDTFCDISLSIDSCTAIVSKFTLVAISVDRYIAIMKPIKYRSFQVTYRPVTKFILIAFFLWMLSLAIALPFLFGLNSLPERISAVCTFYNSQYSMGASIFTFWIPAMILIFMYVKVIMAIGQRARRLSKQNQDNQASSSQQEISQISSEIDRSNDNQKKRFERKTTITIAIVLAIFFICWAPFYGTLVAQFIYYKVNNKNNFRHWYHYYLYTGWIGYINSCLNFIIYTFFSPLFQNAFKKHILSIFSARY